MQQCRICLQHEDVQLLLQPCRCSGSIQYVHPACLHFWLQRRFRRHYRQLQLRPEPGGETGLRCELCRAEYRGERKAVDWRRAFWIVVTSGTSVRLALDGVILTYLLYRIGTILVDILQDAHHRKVAIHRLSSVFQRLLGYGGLWVRVWMHVSAVLLFASAFRVFARDVVTLSRMLVEECKEFRVRSVERSVAI